MVLKKPPELMQIAVPVAYVFIYVYLNYGHYRVKKIDICIDIYISMVLWYLL